MKRLPVFYLLLLLFVAILTDCKKNSDVHPQNPSSDTTGTGASEVSYNKNDTTVDLQNSRIRLDIPAGAMKEGTEVSIGNSTVKFIDTAHLLHQFELLPEGTTFQKPVTLIFHYDSAWLKGNSPWNIGIAYKNDDDGKWYPAVNGDVDTVNHTISIKTRHFSHWSIYTCFHLYMKADGQLSEDYSQTIRMQPGDIGLLLLTMDEPPAWKNDPDKSKEFSDPLVAPLTTPPVDPKESYSKSLAPDEWDVNAIVNGDEHVGKIIPVSGAREKLYQYLAPSQVPENNPVAVSATIHTQNHGDIILIQPVEILGKWKLEVTDSVFITAPPDGESDFTYHYGTEFHINNQSQVVYDGETHSTLKFFKLVAPGLTSWKITSANYLKIDNITGHYDENTNQLDCGLNIGFSNGTTTITLCDADDCATNTTDGSEYDPGAGDVHLILKAESGYKFVRDTTFGVEDGKVHIYETYALSNVK